jgi:hypothetical protein
MTQALYAHMNKKKFFWYQVIKQHFQRSDETMGDRGNSRREIKRP